MKKHLITLIVAASAVIHAHAADVASQLQGYWQPDMEKTLALAKKANREMEPMALNDPEFTIFLFGQDGKFDGKTITVKPNQSNTAHIHMSRLVEKNGVPQNEMFTEKFAIKLEEVCEYLANLATDFPQHLHRCNCCCHCQGSAGCIAWSVTALRKGSSRCCRPNPRLSAPCHTTASESKRRELSSGCDSRSRIEGNEFDAEKCRQNRIVGLGIRGA